MSSWIKKTLFVGLVVAGAAVGSGTVEAGYPSCHNTYNPPVYVAPKPTYHYQKSYQPSYRPAPTYHHGSHYNAAPAYRAPSYNYGRGY